MSLTSLKLRTKISLVVALLSLPIVILGCIYVSKREEGVAMAHEEVHGVAQTAQPARRLADEGAVRDHLLPQRQDLLRQPHEGPAGAMLLRPPSPGGWLYIGHSETPLDQKTVLRLRSPTIYQKGS